MLGPDDVTLEGKVALITGAAQGIGEAIALTFARFGASVAMCDRNADGLAFVSKEIDGLGQRVVTGVLDVRDEDQVDAFVDDVERALDHRIDVLVNNAGGGFESDFMSVNAKGQDALIRENFTSVTHCIRACAAKMPARGGSIVNITSIEAHRAAPGYAVYSAMKAALVNLSMTLALELGDRRIRVNCIAPDVIPTPGIGCDLAVKTPLPYAGHVDDVAAAVVYLASDWARFVTGSTIHVDGGNLAAGGWGRSGDDWVTAGEPIA